jgi:hypothetical protein
MQSSHSLAFIAYTAVLAYAWTNSRKLPKPVGAARP